MGLINIFNNIRNRFDVIKTKDKRMVEAEEDMESLMAQMEREYEEAELKKKADKKNRKKGNKALVDGEEPAPAQVIKKEPKKPKKTTNSKKSRKRWFYFTNS